MGGDMMSTIEIQRDEENDIQRLRGSLRQNQGGPAEPGQKVTSSGIEAGTGADPEVNMLSTIEIERSDTGPRNPRNQRGGVPSRPGEQAGSGIDVELEAGAMAPAGMTGTVTLSRKGMGSKKAGKGKARRPQRASQQKSIFGPLSGTAPDGSKYAIVHDEHVECPGCNESFPVPAEVYGAIAECPDCTVEFKIMPPGSQPPSNQPPPMPKSGKALAPVSRSAPAVGAPAPKPAPIPTPKPVVSNEAIKPNFPVKEEEGAEAKAPSTPMDKNKKLVLIIGGAVIVLVLIVCLKIFVF